MKRAIKICGVKTQDAFDCSASEGATHIGFNFFASSPRYITPENAATLASRTSKITAVALTVNATDQELDVIAKTLRPHLWQLHGSETVERIAAIKQRYSIPVMKAVAIETAADIAVAKSFEPIADWLLFDAKPGELPGGNGLVFDWKIIAGEKWSKPWMLSGGLTAASVKDAIYQVHPTGVDVSSGVELSRGEKDCSLISSFISNATAAFDAIDR